MLWIDTEKESALTYADEINFTHLPGSPYDPRDLAATLIEAARVRRDQGGTPCPTSGGSRRHLDIAGRQVQWVEGGAPRRRISLTRSSGRTPIIVCVRLKIACAGDPKSGKHIIVKETGHAPQQDDTLE